MLRLTLDLTRRRLAEVCAVEVVKGAVAPPTPDTETWCIAVREAVYALRRRGWPSTYGRLRWSTGPARPADKPDAKPPTAKNGALFSLFLRFRFFGTPKNGASLSPNAV
jgi:hypothetical protein